MSYNTNDIMGYAQDPIVFSNEQGGNELYEKVKEVMVYGINENGLPATMFEDTIKSGGMFGTKCPLLMIRHSDSSCRFFMIGIWIAILSGTLMSIQGVWNTQVTKQSSLWVSTGWVQLTAFLVCVAAWFFTGRDSVGTLWQVENKYTLLGGILGTFITVTVIRSMGKLGPAQATMLIVIAQLVVSYLIEMFGLFGVEKQPFEWKKLAGTAIVVAGIVLFKWE